MRDIERRLRVLEADNDPDNCLDCAIRRLNRQLGYTEADEPCSHPRKALVAHIVELDATVAGGLL
jgi:hypothetical protein